jgi:hypothetical protein
MNDEEKINLINQLKTNKEIDNYNLPVVSQQLTLAGNYRYLLYKLQHENETISESKLHSSSHRFKHNSSYNSQINRLKINTVLNNMEKIVDNNDVEKREVELNDLKSLSAKIRNHTYNFFK